jgi:DNA invertase Pin-like site-specific DNA recombinase
VALGWPIERVHTIDRDQGRSGARAQSRDGFERLVSEVVLRRAGLLLGLEVSRLARNDAVGSRKFSTTPVMPAPLFMGAVASFKN